MTFDSRSPVTKEQIAKASKVALKDERGESVTLSELVFNDSTGKRTSLIFIRHFYCGLCQDFIAYLSAHVKPEQLQAADAKIVIIGCGDSGLISSYKNLLKCPFPIYADPSKESYVALGMTLRTLDQGQVTPEYANHGTIANVLMSIARIFKMGKLGSKAGDIKQLGGEFVFNGYDCVYAHRMENTRGHAPLAEILDAAGVHQSA